MNIYALKGHKVKCSILKGGYKHHEETANIYLSIGNTYTVENIDVEDWHTDVYLQEFPGIAFNSIFFEDESIQVKEGDKKHPYVNKINMTYSSGIKQECEKLYEQIKNAEEKLEELRKKCKHENTHQGLYSWRVGCIADAIICSDCGSFRKNIEQIHSTIQRQTPTN